MQEPNPLPRLEFLIHTIAQSAEALTSEFAKTKPDFAFIKENFYLLSWRINELSWGYKYKLKNDGLISEEIWHLFDFICNYLTSSDVDFSGWKEVANEALSLARILKGESKEPLKAPCLIQVVQSTFAASQLEMIHNQIVHFCKDPFDASSSIDCHALLGLLMIIGEGSKRLEGLIPALPTQVVNILEIIKEIRNLLEKKLPGNLFTSPKLMASVCDGVKLLGSAITNFKEGKVEVDVSVHQDTFQQLYNLLEEESAYKYPQQAKIFFEGLPQKQKDWLKYLQEGDYKSFLSDRFNIDYAKFKEAIAQQAKQTVLTLTKEQRDMLAKTAEQKLANHTLLPSLLKLIRSPKTPANGITRFLQANNLNVNELMDVCSPKGKTNEDALTLFAVSVGRTKEELEQIQKLFVTLDKHRDHTDFYVILFDNIKKFPELLNLTQSQLEFLKVLNQEAPVNDKESLDKILKDNGLDGPAIDKLLHPSGLLYNPKPYYKKFLYPVLVSNEITRVIRMIDELIKLLVRMKNEAPNASFVELLTGNSHYQFALQLAIKAFGVIVKDKLSQEAKRQLLAANSDGLSSKHIGLLELFRNSLAHRAAEIDVNELAWFALHWALLSYPALMQHAVSMPTSAPAAKSRTEVVITKTMLVDQVRLIQDLAKTHGFKKVRVFGDSLGCALGIQTELNLIVDPLPSTGPDELYELQWQLHYIIGWNIKVFTEASFRKNAAMTLSQSHVEKTLEQTIDLVSLQHLERVRNILKSEKYHSVIFVDQSRPIRKPDIDPARIDLQKVKTVVLASQAEDFLRLKQDRQKLLENKNIKALIQKKAQVYVQSLLEKFNQLKNTVRPIIVKRLKITMELNNELDEFYEKHMDEIQSYDQEISRFSFRHIMRTEHHNLPLEIRNSALAKKAKEAWDNEAFIIEDMCKEYGRETVNLCNILNFLLDEVRNPNIPELLQNTDTQYEQLLTLVYMDFCKRFTDPFEEEASVTFTEPLSIDLSRSQTLSGINMTSQTRSGATMISFDRPIFLTQLFAAQRPVQHDYVRIPFYAEVLEELSPDFLPMPILNGDIDIQVRYKALNIRHGYKPLPKDKLMTIDQFAVVKPNWVYQGKVQKLNCQAITFDYPPTQDFDSFLAKEGINQKDYPGYEKDKKLFNEFQIAKFYLDNIYYYEKQIRNLERYQHKLKEAASTLESSSEAYWLNQEHAKEIADKVFLLRGLQQKNIVEMMNCQYISKHPHFYRSDFKQRIIQELVDWVYHDASNSTDKSAFHNFVLNCIDDKKIVNNTLPSIELTTTVAIRSGSPVQNRAMAPSQSSSTSGLFNDKIVQKSSLF